MTCGVFAAYSVAEQFIKALCEHLGIPGQIMQADDTTCTCSEFN